MKLFDKQPSERLDYDIDASDWLTQGDNVTGVILSIDLAGELTIDDYVISDDRVKIWLSAGNDGTTYKVTALIFTEDGRRKEYDFKVRVKDT